MYKNAIKMSNWISNGGWIVICLLGGTGIIFCSFGMIVQLINVAQTEDLALFLTLLVIGLIVWGAACLGIYGIIKTIKRNKDLFNL